MRGQVPDTSSFAHDDRRNLKGGARVRDASLAAKG